MLRGQPSPPRSNRMHLEHYSLHLILGWVASLSVVLLLLHLPFSRTSPRVGWTMNSSGDRIALSEIARETEEPESESSIGADQISAPPPTRHAPPSLESSSESATGEAETETESTKEDSPEASDSEVQSIASLSVVDRHPQILGGRGALNLHIQYPVAARRQGIEGRLELTFTVDKKGIARHIIVSKSLHPLCDSAAVDALQSVRFEPATHNGDPIPVRMSLPVRFKLQTIPALPPGQRKTASRDS